MGEKILKSKSFQFSKLIITIYKIQTNENNEFVVSRQLLRAGTAVGALIREAEYAQSRSDFINKLSIAAKECNEALYWLELIEYSINRSDDNISAALNLGEEIRKMLASSIITTKKSIQRKVRN